MSIVYIRFDREEDEARGVEELAQQTRVTGYPGGVYSVREEDLPRLDMAEVSYRRADEGEVDAARGSLRYPASALL